MWPSDSEEIRDHVQHNLSREAGFFRLEALWPAPNTIYRDPHGQVSTTLSAPPVPPEVIAPYSDYATRTTYTADAEGRPVSFPAAALDRWLENEHDNRVHEWLTAAAKRLDPDSESARVIRKRSTAVRIAAALRAGNEDMVVEWLAKQGIEEHRYRGVKPWLDHSTLHLNAFTVDSDRAAEAEPYPLESQRTLLAGEPADGMRGKTLPYPERAYGRPQAYRLHTCIACGYGKFDAHERNFDLCKDCHRIIGSIPHEMYVRMRDSLERRGLVEARALSFAGTPDFTQVARALAQRWRAENLEYGASAGTRYLTYPRSDVLTRRTLTRGEDGNAINVAAEKVFNADLPLVGRYPRRETLDLSSGLANDLARAEDDLMLAGDRDAQSDESPFEVEPDSGWESWRSSALSLSDFTDQGPVIVQKGTGLSKEEIFELSDAVDRNGGAGRGRNDVPRAQAPTDLRHLRGHADPLFHAGPSGEWLTAHALAGALSPEQRNALRSAEVERDWAAALVEDRRWTNRMEELRGIEPDAWREVSSEHEHGTVFPRVVTPPVGNRGYAGPTGVDEDIGPHERNAFLASHQGRVHAWLTGMHEKRVREWLQSIGNRNPLATAVELSAVLRGNDAAAIRDALKHFSIDANAFEEARAWLDEVNPTAFDRAYELNPKGHAIGDLTPEEPIRHRLDRQARERGAEKENWRVHGSALSPEAQEAAVAEYHASQPPVHNTDDLLAGIPGVVAVQRGAEEAPREFGNARARQQVAHGEFRAALNGVFADPEAFSALFHRVSAATRRDMIERLNAEPDGLERKFGSAARLTAIPPTTLLRGEGGAVLAPPEHPWHRLAAASRLAAGAGRSLLRARREFRRVLRDTDAPGGALDDARARLEEARGSFREVLDRVFADPQAFAEMFERSSSATCREMLKIMHDSPAVTEARFGESARHRISLESAAERGELRVVDVPREHPWPRVAAGARAAARAGSNYLEAVRDVRRAEKAVLHAVVDGDELARTRIEFRAATVGLLADPAAFHRAFDRLSHTHKREVLAALADGGATLTKWIGPAGRLVQRTIDERWDALLPLVPTPAAAASAAAEAGKAYLVQVTRLARTMRQALRTGRGRSRAETIAAVTKHLPEAGAINTHVRLTRELKANADRQAAERMTVSKLDRSRDTVTAVAREFRRQLDAVFSDPRTFVARLQTMNADEKREVFDVMASGSAAELHQVRGLGKAARLRDGGSRYAAVAAAHGRHYVELSEDYRASLADSARALELPDSTKRGEVHRAVAARVTRLEREARRLTAQLGRLPEPDLGRAAAHWQALGDAERAHVTIAFPHLASAMNRVDTVRGIAASGIGRQRRTTALKEHSGQHRPKNKQVAVEL
ncbi:MAG TPA: hypothetical protein VFS20_18265 [Longimicrobium sp.]|nr:hypothetical protein [Longimicrobium sp.]